MIKSFEVDHTTMKAPCIRLADIYERSGVVVRKYDLRFVVPNTTYIDDRTMHSMEHLLATSFKTVFKEDMIDLSPMGCKTGFYFTLFVDDSHSVDVNDVVERKILQAIKYGSDAVIPVPTEANCGSYLLHNVEGARIFIRKISEQLECMMS